MFFLALAVRPDESGRGRILLAWNMEQDEGRNGWPAKMYKELMKVDLSSTWLSFATEP